MKELLDFLESKIEGNANQTIFRIVRDGKLENITAKDVRGWLQKIKKLQKTETAAKNLVMANSDDAKRAYIHLIHIVDQEKEQKKAA